MDWKYILKDKELVDDIIPLFDSLFSNKIYYPKEVVDIMHVFDIKITSSSLMNEDQFVNADDGTYSVNILYTDERWLHISFRYYILTNKQIEMVTWEFL